MPAIWDVHGESVCCMTRRSRKLEVPSFDGWRWEEGDSEGVGTIPGYQENTVFKEERVLAGIISGAFMLKTRRMPTITFYFTFFSGS